MKKILMGILILLSLFMLSACNRDNKNQIRVGTIAGPETSLMEVAKDVAKKRFGLDVELVTFSDYIMPNAALNDGSIDANMFQHLPYLDEASKQHHYNFAVIGKTFIYPVGIYSKKYKTLTEIPNKASVALPNDPSNETRALLLLQQANLIRLKSNVDENATLLDIEQNPKQLQFTELDAAQLPRTLSDVDLAVINTNYAVPAGLNPLHDALFHETGNSPYANILVVRKAQQNDRRFHQLLQAIQSPEVISKAKELFGEAAIPAWENK